MTPEPDRTTTAEQQIERLASRTTYENRWMSVREDRIRRPDGSEGIYGHITKADFALVIPYENDGFHLIQQHRYPTGQRSWEFPQGTWPDGRNDDPESLARTELAEETGIHAGRLQALGSFYPAPGLTRQACHVFLATELQHGDAPARELEEQDMTQTWVPRATLDTMIKSGEITDGSTIAAYTLLAFAGAPSPRD